MITVKYQATGAFVWTRSRSGHPPYSPHTKVFLMVWSRSNLVRGKPQLYNIVMNDINDDANLVSRWSKATTPTLEENNLHCSAANTGLSIEISMHMLNVFSRKPHRE